LLAVADPDGKLVSSVDVSDPDGDEHVMFVGRRSPAEKFRRQIEAG
jgi:hypothetical protein